MSWKINLIGFVVILSSCSNDKKEESATSLSNNESTSILIEASDLENYSSQSNYKLIDFRKREDYDQGHINGALSMWRTDIEDSTYAYGGMMASKQQIEKLFSLLGISNHDTLIIYDDRGLCEAARLWWILQNYDFENVKLLNGGYPAWLEYGGKPSIQTPVVSETTFTLNDSSSMKLYISKEDVINHLNQNVTLLDTRSVDEFTGENHKKGAFKAGRISNSVHIDWANAIDYNGNKKLKSIQELESIYSDLLDKKDSLIIVYCHSGVRSAHTTFVLTQLLGFKKVKNYDGSWIEWSHFDELKFEKDSLTTITI